ncbi:MAG TPA: tetratricopeptide repeat protein, partial [Ktedonobacteraceae bacterium]|nr:tetratricopeptide repeat protein [Ktedonobacteraceae bacterium]
MKTRTSIVIMFVIICIFTIVVGVYLTIASVAPTTIPSISATPTPVPTVAVTPTPTPTALQNFSNAESTIFGLSLTTLTYFATILISVLILLLLLRIWNLSGKSNLVIDTFNNTTGNDAIGKELGGLNQLTREFLARELANIQLLVNKNNDQGLDHFIEFPPPETAADVQLTTVLNSLIAASTGEAQTAVQLLNIVLTPRGTKVITTLHSLSELPVTFGLSFELMDLEGKREPVPVTFWEPIYVADDGTRKQAAPAGATVPQAPPVQLAQTYYELGEHLDRAGLYEDAITYFELALKQDGSFHQAVVSLGASLSRWQVQKSGVSAYEVGKQLQDAGLLRPAIENYKIPLLPQHQVAAEHAWETVLKLRQGDEAHAYFSLGEFYLEDGVYLFDQSLELFKAAIAHGSHAASTALQTRQQASARNLVGAAQILLGLKQFSDAEKYTTMALVEVPGDLDAQSLSGRLKEYKPTQGDPVALASYNLGHIYEMRGALDDAIDQYEAALKKQPDYGEASTALVRVLQNRRSPDQRFLELLKPAVRWLAIEIALRSMEDQRGSWNNFFSRRKRQKNEWRTNYQAKLYNYFGYVHQDSAFQFPSSALFYNRAITLFNKASQFDKTWFLPLVNLGVTYMLMAQETVKRQMPLLLSNKGIEDIYKAL